MITTPTTAPPLLQLLAPRHWLTWAGLGLMWVVAQLPFSMQVAVGRLLGRCLHTLAKARRHIVDVNLALCFPELTGVERKALARAHFRSLGIGVVETAMSWWTPRRHLQHLICIEGLQNLHDAQDQGLGVILLSAHFTTLEIGGRLLAMHTPFHVLYRQHKNPVFEKVMRRAREIHFDKAIPRGDIRAMLQSLKDNMPVWYAPDQNYGREHSVFVPFFGVPAATITATSRLARISGARVVPFFQHRLANGRGYKLELYPALEGFPSGDVTADTHRINELIEAQIRKHPEQYLWAHRRFKTRPTGEPRVY